MYYQRTLSETIKTATKAFKVILVTGPRQVGKTTLFTHLGEPDRTYVSLDDVEADALAQTDPALFFQTYQPPILIAEVQRAPGLLRYIKQIVDRTDEKGLFWLTGSQQFHLMKDVSESLAGRVVILDLQGFSQAEKLGDVQKVPFLPDIQGSQQQKRTILSAKDTFDMIVKGSYPQLFDGITPWDLFYSSYLRTYLERDVREIINISNEAAFVRFLKVLACRTSQLLNYSDVSRDVGISVNTVKAWLSVLQTSGLIYLLQPYFANNPGKRMVKTPKMYFMDTGLCSYLCGASSGEMALHSSMSGALLETYAVSEIVKSYWHNGRQAHLYFYRDTSQKEIDLLIEENGMVYPIEIKQTGSPTLSMAANFSLLNKERRATGAILCLSDKCIPMNKDVNIIPIGWI
ncbi:MAG: ATP-binding protein [Sphaerochaetaceae bacterium]